VNLRQASVAESPVALPPVEGKAAWTGSSAARTSSSYQRLLETVTREADRQWLLKLLAEEQQKQKDAGDPEFPH
jgi:hypothetical protein